MKGGPVSNVTSDYISSHTNTLFQLGRLTYCFTVHQLIFYNIYFVILSVYLMYLIHLQDLLFYFTYNHVTSCTPMLQLQ